jgi:predicted nucleic acid-binding protein
MNGLTNDLEDRKSVVFDTNVLIKYINKLPGFIDIDTLFTGEQQFVSVVTRMELLAFPALTVTERERIMRFLQTVFIVPLTERVETDAIEIRRAFRPKLPDAIIAATARVLGATLVTGDGPLAKKNIPGLPLIVAPSSPAKAKRPLSKNTLLYVALGCFMFSTLVFAVLFILQILD